jgi:hypothetical protein
MAVKWTYARFLAVHHGDLCCLDTAIASKIGSALFRDCCAILRWA